MEHHLLQIAFMHGYLLSTFLVSEKGFLELGDDCRLLMFLRVEKNEMVIKLPLGEPEGLGDIPWQDKLERVSDVDDADRRHLLTTPAMKLVERTRGWNRGWVIAHNHL